MLTKTLNTMDREGMKGYFIMINNVKIHDNKCVPAYITARGYKPWYLLHCSPFLHPIKEF